jgi:hypothetical protein
MGATLLGRRLVVAAPTGLARQLELELAPLFDEAFAATDCDDRFGPRIELDATGARTGSRRPLTSDPVQNALAEITAFAIAGSSLMCIHAGVVEHPRGLVAIPGFSRHGKSTLVAALVQVGFGYVSDEVLGVDRHTRLASRFPRPIALDATSWQILGLPPPGPPAGREQLVAPTALGRLGRPGPVTDVVLTRRSQSASRITEASRGAAVAPLLTRAFNHYQDGPASFRTVITLLRSARVWQVEYHSAPDLAAELADHLALERVPPVFTGSHRA